MKEVYLMKKIKSGEKGFTLIEVIATLVLVGITAAFAGMWIVSVVNGYLFAKTNASTVQKAQLAMTRLAKEFTAIDSIIPGSTTGIQITYTRPDPPPLTTSTQYTVSRTGSDPGPYTIQLGGNTLIDRVSQFDLTYCDNAGSGCSTTWSSTSKIINISLTLSDAPNTPFTQRVTPRNL
jgi:prepilin-type N-terminal cleavage/methylation domain-containing protein